LHGLLRAAHAFVPVAELYRRLQATDDPLTHDPGFENRFRQIVGKNSDAIEVLQANAEPTEAGQIVLDELAALNDEHRQLFAD
jgi:HEXXH motif-containing protein